LHTIDKVGSIPVFYSAPVDKDETESLENWQMTLSGHQRKANYLRSSTARIMCRLSANIVMSWIASLLI
jgi:hypothetical protein